MPVRLSGEWLLCPLTLLSKRKSDEDDKRSTILHQCVLCIVVFVWRFVGTLWTVRGQRAYLCVPVLVMSHTRYSYAIRTY